MSFPYVPYVPCSRDVLCSIVTQDDMKYILVKGKRKAIGSYGKYVARVVHNDIVTYEDFFKEMAQEAGTAKPSDLHAVMGKVLRILVRHLQMGDVVEIPYLGRMKIDIDSVAVDSPEDFDARKHVKSVHLNFTAQCSKGKQELFDGIKLEPLK